MSADFTNNKNLFIVASADPIYDICTDFDEKFVSSKITLDSNFNECTIDLLARCIILSFQTDFSSDAVTDFSLFFKSTTHEKKINKMFKCEDKIREKRQIFASRAFLNKLKIYD